MKRFGCLFLIMVFALTALVQAVPALAETTDAMSENTKPADEQTTAGTKDEEETTRSYAQYSAKYASVPIGKDVLTLTAESAKNLSGGGISLVPSFEGKQQVLRFDEVETANKAAFTVTVPETGLYAIDVFYYALKSKNNEIRLSLKVNGEIPFRSAGNLKLSKLWANENDKPVYDKSGNQVRPVQVQVMQWTDSFLSDTEGTSNEPYLFLFQQGENTLEITGVREDFVLEKLMLCSWKQPESYAVTVSDSGLQKTAQKQQIILQGEDASLKSSSAIAPMYDRTNVETYPSDPYYMRYNTIGSYNWKTPGEWMEWNFHVEQSGFYEIGMRVRQNYQRATPSCRRITLDGKIPFSELAQVDFDFSSKWYTKVLGEEKPYRIYLTAGDHTLRMEVVPGKTAQITANLQESIQELNTLYRRIIMVTGTDPDLFRDYALDQEIPNFEKTLVSIRDNLKTEYERISGSSGVRTGDLANIDRLVVQLNSFIDDLETIPERIANFSSNISSLSAWVLDLKNQPLEIDWIAISSEDMTFARANANVWQNLVYSAQQLWGSFFMDYSAIGDVSSSDKTLTVWAGLGRDQVQILKELVDEEFTASTGIPVNLRLAKDSMIQATYAGKGPDIALYVAQDQPVNLAVRHALQNLSKFEGFDEAAASFSKESFVPYTYDGGVYGMPLTNSFNMLFYRTDILKELGLNPPETWEELYALIPRIQQNNMNVGLPKVVMDATGASSGSTAVFDMLLLQRGMSYYNADQSATRFNTPQALEAFREWTNFYTKYGVPQDYDFYNRFRTGEMPIGISNYTLYNQLSVGAPEIGGLWAMAQLPGTKQKDGTINRASGFVGTCAVMFNKCPSKNGWAFLKWYTSADVQSAYGRSTEALLGASARYDTANKDAMKQLPWTRTEQQTLLSQWEDVQGIPQVPASYFVSRNLYNAFRNVTIYYSNPREVLYKYNTEMNSEILRKRVEFGLK